MDIAFLCSGFCFRECLLFNYPVNDSIILGVGIRRYYNNEDYSLLALYNTNGQEVGFNQITNSQIGPDIHSNFIKKDIVQNK